MGDPTESSAAVEAVGSGVTESGESIEHALILAIEQAAEAVIVTDAEGVIRYVNRAFELTTGYMRAEVQGRTPAILKSGVHEPEFYEELWSTLRAGEVWRGEFCNRRKDGSLFRESASILPIHRSGGEAWGYVAVKQDVTRERTLEQQLVSAQRIDSIGRLVGGVAHDFNNILTVMLTYLQFLEEDLPAAGPMQEDLAMVIDAARRATTLVSQLLAFSNRQAAEPRKVDLNESVGDLQKMLRRIVGEDVTLTLDLDASLQPIFADPAHVEQVIMNLVVNAREAMRAGGTLTVKTELISAKSSPLQALSVALHVIDTGEGMDEATRKRAAEPFFSTKGSSAGVGLGLATVRDIVQRCHGTIAIDSKPAEGTNVAVYLPVAQNMSTAPAEAASTVGEAIRLLVVDDDEQVRAAMRRSLRRAGYSVSEAGHGQEALELLAAAPNRYALVVSDVVMPVLSGGALRQRMAASYPQIPVLLVSGYHGKTLTEHGVDGSGPLLLPKPFSVTQLLDAVSSLLQ